MSRAARHEREAGRQAAAPDIGSSLVLCPSIRKFVRTARRCRTIEIQAGDHTITAADPLPADLRDALNRIHRSSDTH